MFVITFHAIMIFESRTLWVWNCLHENRVRHEIATQLKVILGHSFCNQLQTDKGWHIAT